MRGKPRPGSPKSPPIKCTGSGRAGRGGERREAGAAEPVRVQAGASPRVARTERLSKPCRRQSRGGMSKRGVGEEHPEKTSPLFLVAQYGGGREADEEEND